VTFVGVRRRAAQGVKRVLTSSHPPQGAFSEFVLTPAVSCWRVPAATPESVACTISGVTAAASLSATAKVKAGDTVLVTAAAGGTGHFAVQVAVAAGAHVVATCGGGACGSVLGRLHTLTRHAARKAELVRSLGAHRVIDHTAEDVAAVLAAEYPRGVDIVYEGVGGSMLVTAMNALAENGRLLIIGYISGYPVRGSTAAVVFLCLTLAALALSSTSPQATLVTLPPRAPTRWRSACSGAAARWRSAAGGASSAACGLTARRYWRPSARCSTPCRRAPCAPWWTTLPASSASSPFRMRWTSC